MKRGRKIVLACLIGLPLLVFLALLIGPEIDNYLNILNSINLAALKDYQTHSRRLEDLITSKYRIIYWRSYHPDTLYTSTVSCVARDPQGHQEVLSWEVGRFHPLKRHEGRRMFYVTPLTASACCLTPWLGNPVMSCSNYPPDPVYQATSYLWPEEPPGQSAEHRDLGGSDTRSCP